MCSVIEDWYPEWGGVRTWCPLLDWVDVSGVFLSVLELDVGEKFEAHASRKGPCWNNMQNLGAHLVYSERLPILQEELRWCSL